MNRNQNGSVLTVSLLILLVLTIIGVSALSNTVMEEKMSANFQNDRKAFQAAESAVNLTLLELAKDEQLLGDSSTAANDADVSDPSREYTDDGEVQTNFASGKTSQSTVIRYSGVVLPRNGSKINVDHSNTLVWHKVNITAEGTVDDTNAKSVHVQGVMKGPLAR